MKAVIVKRALEVSKETYNKLNTHRLFQKHTIKHCNTPQHSATHRDTLQHAVAKETYKRLTTDRVFPATHGNTL